MGWRAWTPGSIAIVSLCAAVLQAWALDASQVNANDPKAPNVSSAELAAQLQNYNSLSTPGSRVPAAPAAASAPGLSALGVGGVNAQAVLDRLKSLGLRPDGGNSMIRAANLRKAQQDFQSQQASDPNATGMAVKPADASEALALLGKPDRSGHLVTSVVLDTPQGHINVVDPHGPYAARIMPMATAMAGLVAANSGAGRLDGVAKDTAPPPSVDDGASGSTSAAYGLATNKVTKSNCELPNPNGINAAAGGKQQGDNAKCP